MAASSKLQDATQVHITRIRIGRLLWQKVFLLFARILMRRRACVATMRDALLQVRLSRRGALLFFRKGVTMDQQPHTESEAAPPTSEQQGTLEERVSESATVEGNETVKKPHNRKRTIVVIAAISIVIIAICVFALTYCPHEWTDAALLLNHAKSAARRKANRLATRDISGKARLAQNPKHAQYAVRRKARLWVINGKTRHTRSRRHALGAARRKARASKKRLTI